MASKKSKRPLPVKIVLLVSTLANTWHMVIFQFLKKKSLKAIRYQIFTPDVKN